jgi:hypothetical protein
VTSIGIDAFVECACRKEMYIVGANFQNCGTTTTTGEPTTTNGEPTTTNVQIRSPCESHALITKMTLIAKLVNNTRSVATRETITGERLNTLDGINSFLSRIENYDNRNAISQVPPAWRNAYHPYFQIIDKVETEGGYYLSYPGITEANDDLNPGTNSKGNTVLQGSTFDYYISTPLLESNCIKSYRNIIENQRDFIRNNPTTTGAPTTTTLAPTTTTTLAPTTTTLAPTTITGAPTTTTTLAPTTTTLAPTTTTLAPTTTTLAPTTTTLAPTTTTLAPTTTTGEPTTTTTLAPTTTNRGTTPANSGSNGKPDLITILLGIQP